jgi:hypothetical protein
MTGIVRTLGLPKWKEWGDMEFGERLALPSFPVPGTVSA